ncbi:hypothetical protein [Rhodopirellula bahusiensis]|nr:hypothetical protein [Rhodopirellula bahusiensis]
MYLANELKAVGCKDDRSTFNDRLIQLLASSFPGMTIDDLVCTPDKSRVFCNAIRDASESPKLTNKVILKALMNLRRAKKSPTGLKTKTSRQSITKRLNQVGSDLTREQFITLANDLFASMYKDRTFDEVACHPNEASDLANVVRRKVGIAELDDHFILRVIMNVRKDGP